MLSLSLLVGLFILCAFLGVSVLITRRLDKTPASSSDIVRGGSALEKNINESSRPTRIFIPNVLARWPWARQINPNYAVLKKEADAWITSLQAFSPKAQDAAYRCDFSKCFPSYSVPISILFDRSPRLFNSP